MLWFQVGKRGDMFPWYHQHVLRRLGMDIAESYYLFILIEEFSRYRTGSNLAEDTVRQSNTRL